MSDIERRYLRAVANRPSMYSDERRVDPAEFSDPWARTLLRVVADMVDRGSEPTPLTVSIEARRYECSVSPVELLDHALVLEHELAAMAVEIRRRARARKHAELSRAAADALERGETDAAHALARQAADALSGPSGSSWIAERWVPIAEEWLTEPPPPQRWLLTRESGPILPSGIVGAVTAPGGLGKTYLVAGLALAVATGRTWLDTFRVEHPGRVALLLAEEDTDEVRRRIYKLARALDLSPDERRLAAERIVCLGLAGRTVSMIDTVGETVVPSALHAQVLTLVSRERYELVVFDPLARFAPAAETKNEKATAAVTCFEQIAAAARGTVLLVHHTSKAHREGGNKGDAIAGRGVTGLVDAFRWQAHLEGSGNRDLRFVVTKTNRGTYGEPVVLVRDQGGALRPPTSFELDTAKVTAAAEERDRDEKVAAMRDAIVAALGKAKKPPTGQDGLRDLVRGDTDIKHRAIRGLIDDGVIEGGRGKPFVIVTGEEREAAE